MRSIMLFLMCLSLGLALGCSPEECDPECAVWQDCLDGECRAKEGFCDSDADCPESHPVCDELSNACVEERDPTAGCEDCEPWEMCNEHGQCVPQPGRCNDHWDCEAACDTTTNECVDHYCDPACEDWQECVVTQCEPLPGRCGQSSDCPSDAPICVTDTNECVEATESGEVSDWEGVIITAEELAEPFERLASLHTMTGIPTRVVTVEEICNDSCSTSDTTSDAPAKIKEWLIEQQGLEYVLLGGVIDLVPSREVSDSYSNSLAGYDLEETFVTDFYYSDLSEWDKNGNGVYAEPEDHPEEGETGVLDYAANLAVGRLPVASAEQVDLYIDKALAYLAEKDLSRVRDALLLSNVATTLDILGGMPFDGAVYFDMEGRTIDIFPENTRFTKLYSLGPTEDSPDADTLTVAGQEEEMESGHNLIVHAGHGHEMFLTVEENGDNAFTAEQAYELQNSQYPIMLSCACSAGNFAYENGPSAGEMLLNAPDGGAIGYLGNTTIGLGPAGGMQFIDEVLECAFSDSNPRAGDCLVRAHDEFSYPDSLELPIIGSVPVVDQSSWQWTKKSVVYLGDPMLPMVTNHGTLKAPAVEVTASRLDDAVVLDVVIDPPLDGSLAVEAGGRTYLMDLEMGEEPRIIIDDPGVESARAGFVTEWSMPAYEEYLF